MTSGPRSSVGHPLRSNLGPIYVATHLAALLVVVTSIAGILYGGVLYPTAELREAFVVNDVVGLCVGLPTLLVPMWFARRGRLIGLLLWPGALLYVTYNYLAYLFALPVNIGFVLDLVLVALTLYATIGLVSSIDGKALRQRLAGAVPERVAGCVLAGLGLLFLILAVSTFVRALGVSPIPKAELAVRTSDFLVMPAWIIGGVLLLRRREAGYLAGLGLLYQGSTLFVGLIVLLLLRPLLTDVPFAPVDVLVVAALGLVCFIPFAVFVRGVRRS